MVRVPETPISPGRVAQQPGGVQRLDPSGIGTQEARALGDVARGISKVQSAFQQRANELQEQKDAADAMAAYTSFSQGLREFEYGENGILTRQGGRADGISVEAGKNLDDMARRARTGLNERAGAAFDAMANRRGQTTLNSAARHQAKELQTFRDETTIAMVRGAIDDATVGFQEPDRIDAALLQARTAIIANASGKSGEVVQQQIEGAESAIHESVVNRMMLANPVAAKEYFETNKDQINGETQLEIEKKLAPAVEDFEASSIAGIVYDTDKNLADMRKEVGKATSDPDIRREAMRQIDLTRAEEQRDKSAAQNAAYNELYLAVDTGGTTLADAKRTPEWQVITPEMRTKLQAVETAKLKPIRAIESNIRMTELYAMAGGTQEQQQTFAALNLNLDADKLTGTDLRNLTDIQQQIRRGDNTVITGAVTDNQIINDAMRALGIDIGIDAEDDEIASKARFTRRYLDEIKGFTERNGRAPDDPERLKISDRLTIQIADPNIIDIPLIGKTRFGGEEIPVFEFDFGNVPAHEIDDVVASMQAEGIDLTKENFETQVRKLVENGHLPPTVLREPDA